MKSRYVAVVIGMSFVAMLFLCGLVSTAQAEERKGEGQHYYAEKDTFKQQAKEKLARLDDKIAELEQKAKESGHRTKAEAKKGLRDLKQQRVALNKDMKRLEGSSERTWESAKRQVTKGLDKLERTYDKVRDYFR
jgi:peptidoglycan hydrolase CwlO-like protein